MCTSYWCCGVISVEGIRTDAHDNLDFCNGSLVSPNDTCGDLCEFSRITVWKFFGTNQKYQG